MKWESPNKTPSVDLGTEKKYWIAVKSPRREKPLVFLALYQNRPLDHPHSYDWELTDEDGHAVSMVGWVNCQKHVDFDNFYSSITFTETYVLLGWAEYTPPEFTAL
jgi:hypothetical protein